MAEELKPCPFCGCDAKAKVYGYINAPELKHKSEVKCGGCGVRVVVDGSSWVGDRPTGDFLLVSAVSSWNRRAEQAERDDYEKTMGTILAERDAYHEWADKIAHAIGGSDVGEHSNINNPWQNAVEMAAELQTERDALIADNARLREAMTKLSDPWTHGHL